MSENPKLSVAQRRASVLEVASRIDETAAGAMVHFKAAGSMAAELQVAQAMADLRAMLTPEVMAPIMALMDTDLGFRTDRDPKQINQKTNQRNEPYSVDVIRDVVIESKLRGFHTIGNEFNVIAGRFYGAKAGFRRKLTDGKTFPGLTNFRDSYDVPRMVGDRGAIVKCRASWVLNGKPDSVEAEFAIKVNSFMGADAITGKAERKLCKRVHDLLSGVNTPDGEAGDDIVDVPTTGPCESTPPADAPAAPPRRGFARAPKAQPISDDQVPGAEVPPSQPITRQGGVIPHDATPGNPETASGANREPADSQGGGSDPAPTAGPEADPSEIEMGPDTLSVLQAKLADFVVKDCGRTFDHFHGAMKKNKWMPGCENWTSFSDVSDEACGRLLNAKPGLRNHMAILAGAK